MEEAAAVPGVDDQTPGEPVHGGARQREAEFLERRSIQTICEPPHVLCQSVRRRIPPRSFHSPGLVLQMSSVWCFLRATDGDAAFL